MAGAGAAPKPQASRKGHEVPLRGEWQPTVGIGWQHSEKPPPCPTGLMPESRKAWQVWMGAWFASHWTPDDLPGLRQVIRLYDQVERGEFVRLTELRILMDTYGITPKGQQDRRWAPPKSPELGTKPTGGTVPQAYGHLAPVP